MLRNSYAIITTIYTTETSFITKNLKDYTVGMVVDEAAYERDNLITPILAIR